MLLVLALLGRLPRPLLAGSTLLLGLFFLQSIFIALRERAPALAALHPLNGFAILFVALSVAWSSRPYLRRDRAASP